MGWPVQDGAMTEFGGPEADGPVGDMMEKQTARPLDRTVDADEIRKFEAMAEEWWDPDGRFKPLHLFNPVRLAFIRDQICAHFGRDPAGDTPLAGLRLLDIGCGGGLLCEPMVRLGAQVTGLDATERSVHVAKAHAAKMGLAVDYRFGTAESLSEAGERYDVVLNMEVVEHVADIDLFLGASADLVSPGGLMICATLNRTPKAFALAVVGAEYVLGWLPRGTHDWRKFVKPAELAAALRPAGMRVQEMTGVVYNPIAGRWRLSPRDLDVNYMAVATRAA